jgi:hypothetical protein
MVLTAIGLYGVLAFSVHRRLSPLRRGQPDRNLQGVGEFVDHRSEGHADASRPPT